MPRNSAGTYTLVGGNPVVPDTLIETGWANPTLGDIAQSITDSLDRYGRGTMLAPMKFVDGTNGAPSISFGSESSSGWYHPSAGVLAASILGAQVVKYEASAITSLVPIKLTIDGNDIFTVNGISAQSTVPFNVPWPTTDGNAASKGYVDLKFSGAPGGGFLPLSGGVLTGPLTLTQAIYPFIDLTASANPAGNRRARIAMASDGSLQIGKMDDAASTFTAGIYVGTDGYCGSFKAGQGRFLVASDVTSGWVWTNADMVDGYHANIGNVAGQVVVRDGSGYGYLTGLNLNGLVMYNESGYWRTANPIYTNGQVRCSDIIMNGMSLYYNAGYWWHLNAIHSEGDIEGNYIKAFQGHIGGTVRDAGHCTLMMGANRGCVAWENGHLIFGIDNSVYKEFQVLNYSDSRLKNDIKPTAVDALAVLNSLDVIRYTIKPELAKLIGEAEEHRVGLNADQVGQVIPEAVSIASDAGLAPNPIRPANLKQLSYPELVPWIIKALQQLSAKVK